MDSEDTLFMLYTSGSTGRPKGLSSKRIKTLLLIDVRRLRNHPHNWRLLCVGVVHASHNIRSP